MGPPGISPAALSPNVIFLHGASTHMSDNAGHRKFVYSMARTALKRKALPEEVEYALELLAPLSGHKALGFRMRLEAKRDGRPWSWKDL